MMPLRHSCNAFKRSLTEKAVNKKFSVPLLRWSVEQLHTQGVKTPNPPIINSYKTKQPMSIVSDLRDIYGNNITATEVKKYARDRGISYPTVTRKLEQYKVKRGTWNLTIAEELEQFRQLQQSLLYNKTLFLLQIPTSFPSVTLIVSKRFLLVLYFTHSLLLDLAETVRLSRLSKRVRNWVGN